MNVYDTIITRRSTRRFSAREVETEKLEQIITAGRYAPSGGNSQTTHFFVIKDKAVLNRLAEIAETAFAEMELYEGIYRSLASSIMQSKKGGYRFHYNCPVLIVTANRKDYGNNIADCVSAIENMMILANDLDLGSCYINQLNWLNENEEILKLFRSYGLAENERIYASLAIGYPETESGLPERRVIERKGNPVTWI